MVGLSSCRMVNRVASAPVRTEQPLQKITISSTGFIPGLIPSSPDSLAARDKLCWRPMVGRGWVLREAVGKSQSEVLAPCLERLCAPGLVVSVERNPVLRGRSGVRFVLVGSSCGLRVRWRHLFGLGRCCRLPPLACLVMNQVLRSSAVFVIAIKYFMSMVKSYDGLCEEFVQ